jgi:hypothetical protein
MSEPFKGVTDASNRAIPPANKRYFPLDSHYPQSRGITLCITCDMSRKRQRDSAACIHLIKF